MNSVEGGEDIILGEKKTRAAGLHLYEVLGAVRSVETESRPVEPGAGGGELLFGGDRVLVSHDEKILGVVVQEHEQTQHC